MSAVAHRGLARPGRMQTESRYPSQRRTHLSLTQVALAGLLLVAFVTACGDGKSPEGGGPAAGRSGSASPGSGSMRPGGGPGMGEFNETAAVPVETAMVERRSIASFIETNGTLEAENEVDLVARISAPIIDLRVEEGMLVRRGQTLARLDDREIHSQLEISRVNLEETTRALERAKVLHEGNLISPEAYDQALTRHEAAQAQFDANQVQLGYTVIAAPFGGLIVNRYVKFAEQVGPNSPLFRISDFDPLLCPIQVPERELPRLHVGQSAYLTVEAWPGKRFPAEVLRISPVVDAATGTVKVTLEIDGQMKLRPGMFASVYVEVDIHEDALVIPRAALSLDSLGDTVYVAIDGRASRRDVRLGFQEGDAVEVLSGLAEGETVVVVGQDGLSDGTPIQDVAGRPPVTSPAPTITGTAPGRPDFSQMSPEQQDRVKEMMRARGLTEEQIEERLKRGDREGGAGR